MKAKYIIWSISGDNRGIIFDEAIPHDYLVNSMKIMPEDVAAAGFVTLCDGKISCFGESSSLMRSSRKNEDALILARMMCFDLSEAKEHVSKQ